MNKITCIDCFELSSTFTQLDMNPLISIISYVDELQQYVEIYDEDKLYMKLYCSRCNSKISFQDYYITEENKEKLAKKVSEFIGEQISRFIHYCSECEIVRELYQANDMSVSEIGKKMYNEGVPIDKFLEEHFVPSEYVEYVTPFLNCSCCGFGISTETKTYPKGRFDYSTKIFTNEDIHSFLEIDLDDWGQYAEKYSIFLRKVEVMSFVSFLKKNPMLGFKHSIGARFYELFEKMFNEGDYITLAPKVQLFRGRTRQIGGEQFKASNMWEPPFGVSSHGRYNIVGTSVLYLTDNKEIIPYEVNYRSDQELDIALFNVKKPLKILDLSDLLGDFGRYLSQTTNDLNLLKFEYLLTNYISACCIDIGFNGVKYRSVKEGKYNNFVLFNYRKEEDLEILSVETNKVHILYKMIKTKKI
ncbi:RES family NAD+ phosphorylase [Paenibacillus sp. FSL W8-0439]|uniref:RES family NAD+ phosphorylase n=1 Tax=Paenibacillus sp. FSL W8-0439 TaxID=2921716 RepID=UPI0030F939F7